MSPKPPKKSVKTTEQTATKSAKMPALVPRPDGRGALLSGGMPGNAGGGRPKDALVAQLRAIALEDGVPFLKATITDALKLPLLGECEQCGHDQPFSEEWTEVISNRFKASKGERLKAVEICLKFGQAKELVIADLPTAEKFFNCITTALVNRIGQELADEIAADAVSLMDGAK